VIARQGNNSVELKERLPLAEFSGELKQNRALDLRRNDCTHYSVAMTLSSEKRAAVESLQAHKAEKARGRANELDRGHFRQSDACHRVRSHELSAERHGRGE